MARKAFAVRFATHELRTAELLHRVKGAAPATWTVTEGRGAQGAFDDAVAAAQSVATRNPHANFADRLTDPEFIASSRRVLATSSELPAGYHVDTSDKTIKTLTDMLSS